MRYTVVLIPDESSGHYVAFEPANPGCTTQGDSVEEAIARAQDAATGMLILAIEHNEDVPAESAGAIIANMTVDVPIPAAALA